jgi:hypothetical protein
MTATVAIDREPETTPGDKIAPESPKRRWLPWAVLGLAAVSFVIGFPSIHSASSVQSQWGLIGTASPAWTVSFLLTTVGLLFAIRQRSISAAVAATILIGVVLRLPRSLANDMPMFSWTYKHIGVVDYIQHAHELARGVDIYYGWPASFALTAWFSDLTGVSATTLAHWFTPAFFTPLFAVLVYGVARAWGLEPLQAVTAMYMSVCFNWVCQDYFSPQAVAMLLAAGILALIGLSRERPTGVWLTIIIFAAAALTHQLTPFWILMVVGLLVITRRLKPWWIVVPLAAIAIGQVVYNYDQVSNYPLFSFDFLKNTQSNIMKYNPQPVFGQRVVSYGNKALAAAIWGSTALVLLYRWRTKRPFWALGVLALAPLLILGGQDYGGEAIFRVYLYCLVGCSIVLAPVVVTMLQGSPKRFLAGVLAFLVATVLSVNGETGTWYAYVMPKEQVETSGLVLSQAELPAYLTPAAPVWPERRTWRYVDYARFDRGYDYPMIYAANLATRHFDTDADYDQFVQALNSRPNASTYLILTNQMQVYCWYFGILPWDALPNLKKRLYNDRARWEPFYDGQGITVFVHRVAPTPAPEFNETPAEAPTDATTLAPAGTLGHSVG